MPGGRGILTDDQGVFDFTELPAGRYTLTVSKSGFVALSYGQRRPLQAGTPLQLADGQQLKGIQFQLPRGSVIGGRVLDEDGRPVPDTMIEIWQANAAGRYHHERDQHDAPLDAHFSGRGRVGDDPRYGRGRPGWAKRAADDIEPE